MKTKFKIVEWSKELDLSTFYKEAALRGFENNSSQQKMIDCFMKERHWNAWILYQNDFACGSIVSHSLDEMGPNAYRICARTCFFPDYNIVKGLYTKKNLINMHQHATPQLLMPTSINWAGMDKDFYITTNDSHIASQRVVHRIWCPEMANMGMLEKTCDKMYRGHMQTFWKLNTDVFLSDLERYPRWQLME